MNEFDLQRADVRKHKLAKLAAMLAFALMLCVFWALGQTKEAEAGSASSKGKNSCVECHSQMGDELAAPVSAMQNDVHARRELSCSDCHGGDPTQDDVKMAMNPGKGFIAKPKPKEIPAFCGKCHSNAEFMKKFNPSLRVDQEVEYFTSVHGKLIKRGETKPATCISCHGFHGIKAVKDPGSPIYPLNVAQTCGQCHSNADYMRSYSIPTDQVEKYNNSVHAAALIKKQDLSAPTCNDCHGNHGAVPPGVNSIANICGSCHSRQSDLFQKSPHKSPFENAGMAACVTCHSNHEVHTPTDEMLGTEEKSVCINCHTEGDTGFHAAAKMRTGIEQLLGQINAAEGLLNQAAKAGMEVSQPQFKLREAHDKMINARVVVHSFSPNLVEDILSQGSDVATKAHQAGQDALDELQFRRKGLAASLIVIFFAVLAIYLKIRQIDNHQPERSD